MTPSLIEPYEKLAEDVVRACAMGDADAVERLGELFGGRLTRESVCTRVLRRLNTASGPMYAPDSPSLADARLFVAKLYDFESWAAFEASVIEPREGPEPPVHGLSAKPPFYKINRKNQWLEPWPPLFLKDWEEIFEAMRHNGMTGLRAAGRMTDAVLDRLARLDLVTSLYLDGSHQVTDDGLKHLARTPRLERLHLSGCEITDRGLTVLRQLPELREFHLQHHGGISDEGLANLSFCHKLERVDLLGSRSGDGVISGTRREAQAAALPIRHAGHRRRFAVITSIPRLQNVAGREAGIFFAELLRRTEPSAAARRDNGQRNIQFGGTGGLVLVEPR